VPRAKLLFSTTFIVFSAVLNCMTLRVLPDGFESTVDGMFQYIVYSSCE
jgi:hypothetical protein